MHILLVFIRSWGRGYSKSPGTCTHGHLSDQSGGATESNWALHYRAEARSKTGFGSKCDDSGMKFPRSLAPTALQELTLEIRV